MSDNNDKKLTSLGPRDVRNCLRAAAHGDKLTRVRFNDVAALYSSIYIYAATFTVLIIRDYLRAPRRLRDFYVRVRITEENTTAGSYRPSARRFRVKRVRCTVLRRRAFT